MKKEKIIVIIESKAEDAKDIKEVLAKIVEQNIKMEFELDHIYRT